MQGKRLAAMVCACVCLGFAAAARGEPDEDVRKQQLTKELVTAVRSQNWGEMVRLIRNGADPQESIGAMGTAKGLMVIHAGEGLLPALREVGIKADELRLEGSNLLDMALMTQNGSVGYVRELVESGMRPSSQWIRANMLALPLAVRNLDVAKLLISRGEDVNGAEGGNRRPLVFAVSYGKAEVVEALLEAGASATQVDQHGKTALHYVGLAEEPRRVVQALVRKGAKINAQDARAYTPLGMAVSSKNLEAVRALIESGADVRSGADAGVVRLAVLLGNVAVLRAVLEAGADPNIKDEQGLTPLGWALHGANPLARADWSRAQGNSVGDAQIDQIAESDVLGMITLLLEKGADPNAGSMPGWSHLSVACKLWDGMRWQSEGQEKGDGGKDRWRFERDVLAMAKLKKSHKASALIEVLLRHGARVTEKNVLEPSAIDVAAQRYDEERDVILAMLRAAEKTQKE